MTEDVPKSDDSRPHRLAIVGRMLVDHWAVGVFGGILGTVLYFVVHAIAPSSTFWLALTILAAILFWIIVLFWFPSSKRIANDN